MPLQDSSKRADHISGLHFPLSGGATSRRTAGRCAEFDRTAQLKKPRPLRLLASAHAFFLQGNKFATIAAD